jgi:hypothetical protein
MPQKTPQKKVTSHRRVLRSKVGCCLGMAWLLASSFCFGQTADRRSATDKRLDEALNDIKLLKQVVDTQARRIARLEVTVKALQAAPAASSEKPAAESRAKEAAQPKAPWQIPFAWGRIKIGMSRAEVQEILGAPASEDSVLDYQTLTYKGEGPGGGTLSGTVKLADDRVAQVSPPDF